jgi:hypothetical protein
MAPAKYTTQQNNLIVQFRSFTQADKDTAVKVSRWYLNELDVVGGLD